MRGEVMVDMNKAIYPRELGNNGLPKPRIAGTTHQYGRGLHPMWHGQVKIRHRHVTIEFHEWVGHDCIETDGRNLTELPIERPRSQLNSATHGNAGHNASGHGPSCGFNATPMAAGTYRSRPKHRTIPTNIVETHALNWQRPQASQIYPPPSP